MNSAVNPEVPITAWATRARRAAKSAIPSLRRSAARGTGEPSDQAANSRAVPAATVRAPAAATRPAIASPAPATHSGYIHQLRRRRCAAAKLRTTQGCRRSDLPDRVERCLRPTRPTVLPGFLMFVRRRHRPRATLAGGSAPVHGPPGPVQPTAHRPAPNLISWTALARRAQAAPFATGSLAQLPSPGAGPAVCARHRLVRRRVRDRVHPAVAVQSFEPAQVHPGDTGRDPPHRPSPAVLDGPPPQTQLEGSERRIAGAPAAFARFEND